MSGTTDSSLIIALPELGTTPGDSRMRDAVDLYVKRGAQGVEFKKYDSDPSTNYKLALGDVTNGRIHGILAGSILSSKEVIKSAIESIGIKSGSNISGTILMRSKQPQLPDIYFTDPAVRPEPSPQQVADSVFATVQTMSALTPKITPRVAFLSFSTAGSASHASVDRVAAAIQETLSRSPKFYVARNEVQLDVALRPEVAKTKLKHIPDDDSLTTTPANILVFPDLNSANIAYKAFSGPWSSYYAIGPVLQGLNIPTVHDLSRGSTTEEIEAMLDVTIQTAMAHKAGHTNETPK